VWRVSGIWVIWLALTLMVVGPWRTLSAQIGGEAPAVLFADLRMADHYIAGEPYELTFPIANLGEAPLEQLVLTAELPPQFNLVQVQSGWFGTPEQFSQPATVVLRYQTSEDSPLGPWREWRTWENVTHRRWGLAFVSELDLPDGVFVSRVQYDFGTVPAGWHWGNGRDGTPLVSGFVTPFGWNGRAVSEGELLTGCVAADGTADNGQIYRQSACADSLRIPPTADIGVWQYPADQFDVEMKYDAGSVIDIEIGLRHQAGSTADLLDPVLGGILPPDVAYLPNSWYFVDADLDESEPISETTEFVPTFTPPRPLFTSETLPDGSTLLRWRWRDVSELTLPYEFAGDNPAVRIRYQVRLSETLTSETLSLAAQLTSESPEMLCWGEGTRWRDLADVDQDGRVGEPICYWGSELLTSYQPEPVIEPEIFGIDFGDALASYGSASHVLSPTVRLGLVSDGDEVFLPTTFADGDDGDGRDDEDGLVWGNDGIGIPGEPFNRVTVVTLNRSEEIQYLSGWIDSDGDGRFADTEQILYSYPIYPRSNPQAQVIRFGLRDDAFCGSVMARFRFGEEGVGATGAAGIGEVEDSIYHIQCQVDLELDVQPAYEVIGKGEMMRWNLTLTNTGPSLAHQVVLSNTIMEGLAYGGHRVNPTAGWSCDRVDQIERTRRVACRLPELASGEAVTMQVAIRVPILYQDTIVRHTAQAETATLERDMSRNFVQRQVGIDKSWQPLPLASDDLYLFAHARFHEAFVIQTAFQEQDFYLDSFVTNPIQLPLLLAFGTNGQRPPYLAVPSCVAYPQDETCNNNNVIEGTLLMDGYTFNEVRYDGETIFTVEKPVWEEAPDPSYVRLSRIADSRMTRCALRGSCIGFDRFRLDADGRAPYGWNAPDDYFYFNFVTKGGRPITCPEEYNGRCIIINDAKPGVYEVHGSVNLALNFQDVRLGGEPIDVVLEPIDAVIYVKIVAPFIEPEG